MPKAKLLRKDWIKHSIEEVVLDAGGPVEFFKTYHKEYPKEFLDIVKKMLPEQFKVSADLNKRYIILDEDDMEEGEIFEETGEEAENDESGDSGGEGTD